MDDKNVKNDFGHFGDIHIYLNLHGGSLYCIIRAIGALLHLTTALTTLTSKAYHYLSERKSLNGQNVSNFNAIVSRAACNYWSSFVLN